MEQTKIGILIPSTSNKRNWQSYNDTYLYNITLKTFVNSVDTADEQETKYLYVFYIGIDRNDPVLDTTSFRDEINNYISGIKNVNLEFQYIYMDEIVKGHLTVMWNRLFKKALDDNCNYFFQCGDDIEFKTNGWLKECIKVLKNNNDIGLTGPRNNNPRILTQSFVSRKHYDLFGYYFPEDIINWCCDDWINEVYKGLNAYFPLDQYLCVNIGGDPRYNINNDSNFGYNFQEKFKNLMTECKKIVARDLLRIKNINFS
jgi:hypothetical protein